MPADAAGDPHYSFPVLTGLSANEEISERAAKMGIYEQFLRDLDGSGQHLTDSVSEVDVADPEDVKALITSGSTDILVHFGQEDFLKRYQEFEQHLEEWKQQYPKLASADMRYEGAESFWRCRAMAAQRPLERVRLRLPRRRALNRRLRSRLLQRSRMQSRSPSRVQSPPRRSQ